MHLDGPLTCLVTDRRRLVHGSDSDRDAQDALVMLAREAVAARVTLIQVREPDLAAVDLCHLVTAIVRVARGSRTLVVVNDRLDVALTAGAHGVHLRGDSIPPRLARGIAPSGFLLGRSVHSVEEARDHAADVDYLIAGTVFPTSSKPSSRRFLGQAGLREIVSAVDVPVLGIGGITVDQIAGIAAAGAAGIAGIGMFLPGGISLRGVVDAVRAQFDRINAAS